ncbi:MAG: MFS transporter [Nocardioides sp.]
MDDVKDFPSRSFLRYWRANLVSSFGTYVTPFALQAMVVLTLHGSAAEVGWLNSVRWLPYLLVGVVVGALVDRYPRRPVMIASDCLEAMLLASIPLLWWMGQLTFPILLLVVLVYGTASVVNGAADMAFLPRLVPREHLQRAHARSDGADAVAMTAGPALAGFLVRTVGAPLAALVDAGGYLYSALMLSRIRLEEPAPTRQTKPSELVREIREGIRWVYRGSGLATVAIATHVWFVGNAIVGVVVAPYALVTLNLNSFLFGLVGTLAGVGALIGAGITTRVGLLLGTGRTIIACHAIYGLGVVTMVAATVPRQPWLAFALLGSGQALYGLGLGMSNSHEMSYRQLITPDELQARTNTTMRSLNRAVIVIVAPLAGILADAWGIEPTLLVAAAIFAGVAFGLALTPFRSVRAPV